MSFNIAQAAPVKRSATGIYDKELWCDECEARSSKLDDYAAEILLEDRNIVPVHGMIDPLGNQMLYECVDADPMRLQLFALSILWRASASKRPEMAGFSLGLFENRIRGVLQTEDPKKLAKYPLILMRETSSLPLACILTPAYSRKRDFVIFHAAGFQFRVVMQHGKLAPEVKEVAVQEGKPVVLLGFRLLDTGVGQRMLSTVKQTERQFGPQNRYRQHR